MEWFWTWGGTCFGFRRDNSLFTHDGREVGRFYDDGVFGKDGRYLGEMRGERRLITKKSKSSSRKPSFSPRRIGGYARYVSYVGYVMIVGYEDFPAPEDL